MIQMESAKTAAETPSSSVMPTIGPRQLGIKAHTDDIPMTFIAASHFTQMQKNIYIYIYTE